MNFVPVKVPTSEVTAKGDVIKTVTAAHGPFYEAKPDLQVLFPFEVIGHHHQNRLMGGEESKRSLKVRPSPALHLEEATTPTGSCFGIPHSSNSASPPAASWTLIGCFPMLFGTSDATAASVFQPTRIRHGTIPDWS
jgi:hypothetical protein